LNYDSLCQGPKEASEKANLKPPVKNPFKTTIVRTVEIVQTIEEMQKIFEDGVAIPPSREVRFQLGFEAAVTEAPRGLLYHSYAFDREGKVVSSNIVTPTSHNSFRVEEDAPELTPKVAHLKDEELVKLFGMLIRA